MSQGNSGIPFFAYYPGSPSGVGTTTFDAPSATLVVDTTNNLVYQKTSAQGSNASFLTLATINGTQTFTNASLTSPTITGGTITGATVTGNISSNFVFCTTQTDATSNTTLADITGMTGVSLVSGATYAYNIKLLGTAAAGGGWKVGFHYTGGTVSTLAASAQIFTASAVAVANATTTADAGSLIASTSAAISANLFGRIVNSTNGTTTLSVQFAANASNTNTSSIYIGAWAEFIRTA